MRNLIFILFLISLFCSLKAQKLYSEMTSQEKKLYNEHILLGQPDKENGPVYVRQGYIMQYNEQYLIPNWVAYHIIPDYLNTPKRSKKYKYYRTDPDMENPVMDEHYTGTGYARGHMAPYFAMGGDRDKNGVYADYFDDTADPYDDMTIFQANYMSNMAPQDQNSLNGAGGPWYALETVIRDKLVGGSNAMELHVVVGGIVSNPGNYEILDGSYEDIGIAIPDYFFQVLIYENENNEYITAGFLFEHVTEPEELPYDGLIDYIVPVDSIEILTGFDFLNELSEFKQRETESVDNKDFWLEKGFH